MGLVTQNEIDLVEWEGEHVDRRLLDDAVPNKEL